MQPDADVFGPMAQMRAEELISIISNPKNLKIKEIVQLAEKIVAIFKNGGKIAFVGNGGSAAEAMHLAAEFTGKCVIDHKPLPAICLNESQSSLTAIMNDFGADKVFSRLVDAHLTEGDLLIALSTSGRSKNVLEAIKTANANRIKTILWMGNFETSLVDVETWHVDSKSTPRIQELHLFWGHVLAECVETAFSDL